MKRESKDAQHQLTRAPTFTSTNTFTNPQTRPPASLPVRFYPATYPNAQPANSSDPENLPKLIPGPASTIQTYYPYAHKMGQPNPASQGETPAGLPQNADMTSPRNAGEVCEYIHSAAPLHQQPQDDEHSDNMDSQESNSEESDIDEADVTGPVINTNTAEQPLEPTELSKSESLEEKSTSGPTEAMSQVVNAKTSSPQQL